jgi:hypothetical protein
VEVVEQLGLFEIERPPERWRAFLHTCHKDYQKINILIPGEWPTAYEAVQAGLAFKVEPEPPWKGWEAVKAVRL